MDDNTEQYVAALQNAQFTAEHFARMAHYAVLQHLSRRPISREAVDDAAARLRVALDSIAHARV